MSTSKPMIAVGTFASASQARAAIESLREAGFDDNEIGILTHDKDGDPDVKTFKDLAGNKAGTGAIAGVAAGAGGGALWAVGIAAGILPAIGPVIAGGVLAAIAASAAAGAAAGGLVGVLTGLGVSDEEAAYYDEEFQNGRTVVVVKDRERAIEAYQLLDNHGSSNRYATDRLGEESTEDDIEQLNSFLRGEMSAVETYSQCIEKVENAALVAQLRSLKASHQDRCEKLSARIRRLGGEPADDSGVWGGFAKLVQGSAKVFGEKAAVAALEEGEDHGKKDYQADLGELSPSLRNFVATQLVPEQQKTHDALSRIKSSM